VQDAKRFGSRHRLGGLLVLILVSLSVQLAATDTDESRLVIVLLQGATLLAAFWASGIHRNLFIAAALVVAVSVLTAVAALIGSGDIGATPARVVTLLLVGLAPPAIVYGLHRDVKERGRVTLREMFGVLCIYLLLGMFFSFCFNVIQQVSDAPFFTQGYGDVSGFLYFSFSTLTTTGFGDFTAGTNLGRSLSITEALIGQIYLVTVVAMIVANIRPSGRTGDSGPAG
jgi:hypothetical protein